MGNAASPLLPFVSTSLLRRSEVETKGSRGLAAFPIYMCTFRAEFHVGNLPLPKLLLSLPRPSPIPHSLSFFSLQLLSSIFRWSPLLLGLY